ncbi:hypothetical protein E3N88_11901 [Mikania micrantha]|uniref:AP180 N-terminal homology (ANTH) domain-containing protein n=1 Tax=Mikania micrantha TaxID=192012 RepID=A0A5N6P4B1_9ASTR|nr:hypothetical protein E3N88_11901 [Mikania micrantha]
MPQSSALSPSFQKTEFMDPSAKFTSNIVPSAVQIMLGSLNPQGSSKLLSFSNTRTSIKRAIMGVKVCSIPSQCVHRCTIDFAIPQENHWCGRLDTSNPGVFGGGSIDRPGLLLPSTVSNIGTSSPETDLTQAYLDMVKIELNRLENELEIRIKNRERNKLRSRSILLGYSITRDLESEELLEQLPSLQQLLYRLIGSRSEGAAVGNYLIQYALVLKKSFNIYCAMNDDHSPCSTS